MSEQVESIVVKGNVVTAADVRRAMNECDRMGEAAFLKHYGFGRSAKYWLRGNRSHRPYPSKAILAVAARCTKRHGYEGQFFGGVQHTVAQLRRLGFEFRVGDKPVRTVSLDELREKAVALDPRFVYVPEWDKLSKTGVTPVAVFASGTNTAATIKGMASVRFDIGVAAPHISRVCKVCRSKKGGRKKVCEHSNESTLLALAGTDVQVFVDSGAFSEVKFNEEKLGFDVVKPITDAKWNKILDLYKRLGEGLAEQAWVVAPDQVGSQEVTLERLERYADRLAEIADTGAVVMIVAQKGALSQADFFRAALKASGLEGRSNVVAAAPCKKAATSPAELADFVRDLAPEHVHCLGLGPTNPKIDAYMEAFVGSKTTVSLDSCWITANVGKAKGKTKAKPYTRAQELAVLVLEQAGLEVTVERKVELAMLLCLGSPLVNPLYQLAAEAE